jgi:hypothetical protein
MHRLMLEVKFIHNLLVGYLQMCHAFDIIWLEINLCAESSKADYITEESPG